MDDKAKGPEVEAPKGRTRPDTPPRIESTRWVVTRRQRLIVAFISVAAIGFAALNVVSCNHASAMLHFDPAGEKTKRPEDLSIGEKIVVLFTGVTVPRPVNQTDPMSLGLPFEVRLIDIVDARDRLEAWVIRNDEGAGTAILFHGYATSKAQMLPEARALFDMGLAIVMIDFRGSGGSSGDETSVGYREAFDVACAFRYAIELQSGEGAIYLVGNSMGAAAVLRACAKEGIRPDGLILEGVFDSLLETVRNRYRLMGLPSWPFAELLVYWGGRQLDISGFEHNPLDYAAEVDVPALFLHGAEDQRATAEQGWAVSEAMRGEAEFVEFPAAGHGSLIHENPELWASSAETFILSRRASR